MDLKKEIRFAVVLYGGVSLAIYINGVAQEMFKMVRATARKKDRENSYFIEDPNDLSPSERVYRKISEQLGAKFVIDILSGTSAGGINAVYLAKALVNNQKMDLVEDIWIKEGDIAKLINDGESTSDLPAGLRTVLNQSKHKSLLNGQRMYYRLLEAFDNMEKTPAVQQSPFVNELDLFITATDLRGLTLPIRLSNNVVYENRYRNDFHFGYSNPECCGDDRNDFQKGDNPFLAFAASCTSALHFAFEPMMLEKIKEILPHSELRSYLNEKTFEENWHKYSIDYSRAGIGKSDFDAIPFGDGGYLDNKPFSYATNTIANRQSELPVDRKLIYIEPVPEHLEEQQKKEPPDALENIGLALFALPRAETIREDIQLIKERNQIIQRARSYQNFAIEGLLSDLPHNDEATGTRPIENRLANWKSTGSRKWPDMDLNQSVRKYGTTYYSYHHVRVAMVTDDISRLITRSIGFDENSDQLTAIRLLVRVWRDKKYSRNSEEGKETENKFMYRVDIGYRIRRLRFVLQLFDRLSALNETNIHDDKDGSSKQARNILEYAGLEIPTEDQLPAYRTELANLRSDLTTALNQLNIAANNLKHLGNIEPPNIPAEFLKDTLENCLNQNELEENLLKQINLDDFLNQLAGRLDALRIKSRQECDRCFGENMKNKNATLKILREGIKFYFDRYDYFDTITLPLLAGTKAGESDVIDIIRISPEDATSEVNRYVNKRQKLLGTRLGNFGAFFKKEWRQNDILWGQLDAAEIILKSLNGGADKAQLEEWTNEVQAAILREKFLLDEAVHVEALTDAFKQANDAALAALKKGSEQLELPPLSRENIRKNLLDSLNDRQIINLFAKSQDVEHPFPVEPSIASAARATRVAGKVLEDLSTKYSALNKPSVWIIRAGLVLLSLVNLAIPGNFLNILAQHWFKLLYVAEAILIIGGILFAQKEVAKAGWISLAITFVLHMI